jgi:hypothetical protein
MLKFIVRYHLIEALCSYKFWGWGHFLNHSPCLLLSCDYDIPYPFLAFSEEHRRAGTDQASALEEQDFTQR